MVASLKRITYIIIFIPCMRSVLCVDGLEGKKLASELIHHFLPPLVLYNCISKMLYSEVLVRVLLKPHEYA